MMKKKNIVIIAICVLLTALIGIGGWLVYSHSVEEKEAAAKEAAYQKTLETLTAEIDEKMLEVEYGASFDMNKLVKEHTGDMKVEGSVSPDKCGTYPIVIRLSATDEYDEKVEKELKYEVKVSDTAKPELTLAQDYATVGIGDYLDLTAFVQEAKDKVDGDLDYSEKKEPGTWTYETDADVQTAGEYEVKYIATDKNSNQTEKSFILIVQEDTGSTAVLPATVTPETPSGTAPSGEGASENAIPAGYGNYNSFYIRINRAMNTVTIYSLNGDYYEPYFAMVCSTGAATPLGTYSTFNKSRWRLLYGPCYGQYVTDIVGDILFHSVPYYTMSQDDLEFDEYNKLGTAASMGCIRLCVRDALWIYINCAIGTVVELYDDYSSPGPLGKPGSIIIDTSDERRGWDPTDPDPANPWNS